MASPLARSRARALLALGALPFTPMPARQATLARFLQTVAPELEAGPELALSIALDLRRATVWAGGQHAEEGAQAVIAGADEEEQARFQAAARGLSLAAWLELSADGVDGGWYAQVEQPLDRALAQLAPSAARDAFARWAEGTELACLRLRRSVGAGARFTELLVLAEDPEEEAAKAALGDEALFRALGVPALPEALLDRAPVRAGAVVRFTDSGVARVGLVVAEPPSRQLIELSDALGIDQALDQRRAAFEGALGGEGPRFASVHRDGDGPGVEAHYDASSGD